MFSDHLPSEKQIPEMFDLSKDQWQFLSVLAAFSGPISIEVAGALAPLMPGPLFDLLEKAEALNLIEKTGRHHYAIIEEMPPFVKTKLEGINTNEHLNQLVDQILKEHLDEYIPNDRWLHLLNKADRVKEACIIEIQLAHKAFGNGDANLCRKHLVHAVQRLYDYRKKIPLDEMFILATLELSNVSFGLGYGFLHTEVYLYAANETAKAAGYQRHYAMTHLHLGRLFYFSDRREKALDTLNSGIQIIKDLGDDDILSQAAVFMGIFYFIKGLFKDAIRYFERAEQAYENSPKGILLNPTAPLFLGYCAIYLGQFHRAIGSLDFNWRLALERGDKALASTIRGVLGTLLVLLKKNHEASYHLVNAIREAQDCDNDFGLYFARGGIALQHFMEGRKEDAYDYMVKNYKEAVHSGLNRQFASPWILEMFYEFNRLDFTAIHEIEFNETFEGVLSGVNLHLKGVALRLRAKAKAEAGEKNEEILFELNESLSLLEQTGDPVQQSKTILEIARLSYSEGKEKSARGLIQKARRLLGGYVEEFFPDEFRYLMANKKELSASEHHQEEFLQKYIEMIESLYPSKNRHEILSNVLIATSRMFGAERSGLFWFPSGRYTRSPELRATYNLIRKETETEGFKQNLAWVLKAFQRNEHQIGRPNPRNNPDRTVQSTRSVLCIPIEVHGSVNGVFYYDNSYLDDAFDFLNPALMKQMAAHTNLVIERRFQYLTLNEERNMLASAKSIEMKPDGKQIVTQSPGMMGILELVDQIAQTESTILISGETGTGKELLARRIHRKSLRSEKPLVVVDATTIPENLLESELFGHEKGAFTGADKRKIGRIEMAGNGTLFLDEIGELPLTAQVKLLRALQEKTFHRVGGISAITSDFRLIAATNRNLAAEVEKGRFRKDLYFRLNVIPVHLPSLRERIEDITLLAEYFLEHYRKKYKRSGLNLSGEQKKFLTRYKWPGNIRELQNFMERAVLLSKGNHLEINLLESIPSRTDHPFDDAPTLDEIQRRYITHIMKKTNGKISGPGGAAQLLGMKRTSLYSRMRTLGMKKKEF